MHPFHPSLLPKSFFSGLCTLTARCQKLELGSKAGFGLKIIFWVNNADKVASFEPARVKSYVPWAGFRARG